MRRKWFLGFPSMGGMIYIWVVMVFLGKLLLAVVLGLVMVALL